MILQTKRLAIRELRLSDATAISKKAGNLDVAKYTMLIPHPYNKELAEEFLTSVVNDQTNSPRTKYELGITLKPSDEVIGIISLVKVSEFNGTGEVGYWVEKAQWQKGIATEAANSIIEFAFNELKLRRLELTAIPENAPSNNLAKKLGFKLEGTLIKDHRVKSTGEIHDSNIYGLLREDWEKMAKTP